MFNTVCVGQIDRQTDRHWVLLNNTTVYQSEMFSSCSIRLSDEKSC